jgi:tRNA threonylcarbamoyladenosine biosynthesis protein TsaE
MITSKTVTTNSFEQTQRIGFDFAKDLHGGEVLALYGDLGSGKTTFMQGLAKGLGITRNIISPTFLIMRTYTTGSDIQKLGITTLYHLDLYRIETDTEAIDLGIQELMGSPENIVALEWPDKIENLLPEKRINIYFTYIGDDVREIRIG